MSQKEERLSAKFQENPAKSALPPLARNSRKIKLEGNVKFGLVAQRSEQGTHNPLVRGSNPFQAIVPARENRGLFFDEEVFLRLL